MNRVSKKRAELNRKAKPIRESYKAEWVMCQVCCQRVAVDLHEIARGIHRAAAISEPCTFLCLCRGCHDKLGDMREWPICRQLAAKLLADPAKFDLARFNEIRGRAEGAITMSDVVMYLQLKD